MQLFGTLSQALAGVLLLSSVPASAESLTCTIDPGRHRAYIAPEITIAIRGPSEASVSDRIITSTGRRSVVALVDSSKPTRLRIVWDLPEVAKDPLEGRRGPVRLSMRLSVDRSSGAARLEVQDLINRKYSYKALGRCDIRG